MSVKLILTGDGSHTLAVEEKGITYHSIHGAIAESMHVFIAAGLTPLLKENQTNVSIFEMGFGTGLNALLTIKEIEGKECFIYYEALDLDPIPHEVVEQLNYCDKLGNTGLKKTFQFIHQSKWNSSCIVNEQFTLNKRQLNLAEYIEDRRSFFNLIYFDAFAPNAQPELWTKKIFNKMHALLKPGGMLVTYCSKSDVRRAMQSAGFSVEKLQGPKGKREMLRATRLK